MKEKISLEDLIEKERAALGPKQTRVTLETFIAWKKRKIQEKKDNLIKDEEKKRQDYKAGRQVGLSGREMFSFNPELAVDNDMDDGDEAFDAAAYTNDDEDSEEIEYKELNFDMIGLEATEADGTGTVAAEDRLKKPPEENGIDEAAGVPINENLFTEEDLDGLDEELDGLDIEEWWLVALA